MQVREDLHDASRAAEARWSRQRDLRPLVGGAVIARIWRGETRAADADEYMEVLRRTGVPDYRATPGNRDVIVLRRVRGDRAEFLLITLWDSRDAIAAFAGPDIDVARYYPEDQQYLLEFAEQVEHWELVAREPATSDEE
jgi:heme-degrading monooxygenase HmoA